MRVRPGATRLPVPVLLLLFFALAGCGREPAPVAPAPGPPAAVNPLAGPAPESASPSLSLAALSATERERVKEAVGQSVGVRIAAAPPGGPVAASGLRSGDLLFAVDGRPVSDPDGARRALEAGGEVAVLRPDAGGEWRILRLTVARAAAPGAPAAPSADPPAAGPPPPPEPVPTSASPPPASPPPASTAAPPPASTPEAAVAAYFDMLDFSRTNAWGRECRTATAVRDHALALLRESLPELDAETRAAIAGLPAAWAGLRERWAAAGEADREGQREYWRTQLLLPNPFLPYLGRLDRYKSPRGATELEYPSGWIRAETKADDVQMMFLAPGGTETSWEQAANPATSPPGILLVIAPLDDAIRSVKTVTDGARLLARNYVTAYAPELREVAAFPIGPGGMAVLRGRRPGEAEESFVWLGAIPFGREEFFAARFLAPVSRAEELLPAFVAVLGSLSVSPPDDEAALKVELLAAMAGNTIVNAGWH